MLGFSTDCLFEKEIYQEKLEDFLSDFHFSFREHYSGNISRTKNTALLQLFHESRLCRKETSPLIGKANQWIVFSMTGSSIMKELRKIKFSSIICTYWKIRVREDPYSGIFYAAILLDLFTVIKEILKGKLVSQAAM